MLTWFYFSFNCIAPILLLVFMGYFLKRKGVFTPDFLTTGNRFCFHYCISTMLFKTVYDLDGLRSVNWRLCIFIVAALGLLTIVGLAASYVCTDVHERRGVIAQTWMRSNNAIIGFPLAESIGGEAALAALAPLQIPSIAMYNSISVICLTIFSRNSGQKINWKRIGMSILKNPLIRGLLLGLLCLIIREMLPVRADGTPVFRMSRDIPALYTAVGYVSRIATPLSLIILGGKFELSAVAGMKKEIITTSVGRLIIAPIIGFTAFLLCIKAGFLEMDPNLTAALIPIFASPVSVSTVPMAAEMGADDVLAGQLLVWTSLGSMFTLFILIVIMQAIGWL